MRPFLIGIGGGTGSGKTTTARRIAECLGPDAVSLIDADAYYRDLSHLPGESRPAVNFDHPSAMDAELLAEHLQRLRRGVPVDKPVYDFMRHIRTGAAIRIEPRPIIIAEGILIFALDAVRSLFDFRVYIDEDDDIRLLRRILRDISLRGRSFAAVAEQYLSTVRPMHRQFVEPYKAGADMVLRSDDTLAALVGLLKQRIAAVS